MSVDLKPFILCSFQGSVCYCRYGWDQEEAPNLPYSTSYLCYSVDPSGSADYDSSEVTWPYVCQDNRNLFGDSFINNFARLEGSKEKDSCKKLSK